MNRKCGGAAAIVLAIMAAVALPAKAQGPVEGYTAVTDGDTLTVDTLTVHLFGIASLKLDRQCGNPAWACGTRARDALTEIINGRTVRCEPKGRSRRGRMIAICMAGEDDLGARMVWLGWASAKRKEAPAYMPLQTDARLQRRGIWADPAAVPSSWPKQEQESRRSR